MATYANTPDLVSYAPDAMEAVGWQAVKDGYAKSFAQMPGAKLELTQANYKVAGDMVIGYGKWKMTAPTPDGQTSEAFGRYTDVKTSRDGKWVYLLDHASVPFAPPAATPPPSAEPAPAAPGG
jgi:ketosteroid isomerase-like protein